METIKQRIKILNEIFENFQQITQWLPNNIDSAAKYMFKAEALIESLEVEDCGQVGGFDKDNPILGGSSGFRLYDRFTAVVEKYDNASDIKKCCHFNGKKLKAYFLELSQLRDNF